MRLTDFWSLRLTVACIIIFILQLAIPTLTDSLALISSDILVRPWILITSMFAHGSIEHLFYNMFALALFGTILENIIGSRRWLILYFISGIIASIVASAFYPESLGASGAIFGLLGTLAVLRPRITVWVAGIPMPMAVAAGVWAIGDLLGLFVPSGIANAAHLAGLATGIMFGIALRKKFGEPLFIKKKLAKDIDEETFRRWEREWL